jgi:hypothetical protein
MRVPTRHILSQGPVLTSLGRTAVLALQQQLQARGKPGQAGAAPLPQLPGPEFEIKRAPLPRPLIDDYVRHLGGDPRSYRGEVPPHLFPQWCMPLLARTVEALPYPLLRVVNGGCRVSVRGPIKDDEPIVARARLQDIDDDGQRVVLHQIVTTGTTGTPDALVIDFYAIVPLPKEKSGNGASKPRERARVPLQAREIARVRLKHDAGLSFAKLTGDFNPIHWLAPYARASGFPDVILHGFGTFALCWEALVRGLFGGDVHAIAGFDIKLTRPLVLPHEVGVYVQAGQAFVGDAPGGPAYLTGKFAARE